MSLELEIVRDVSERLTRAHIPFMLTGSMAMNAYAEPRMTAMSMWSSRSGRRRAARENFHARLLHRRRSRRPALRTENLFNAIHQASVFKVDCIVRKNTPYRLEEFARRRRLAIAGFETWVVGKEDLILSKLCWGRDSLSECQARDIRNLLATAPSWKNGRLNSACATTLPPSKNDRLRSPLPAHAHGAFAGGALLMCEAARATVLASLPADLAPIERKIALLRRYYGGDFSEQELGKIEQALRLTATRAPGLICVAQAS